ncbi:MAG: SDR family oxidoreductase [Phycisphaerae bacterium]|nr:SDR family oxidoreductase [Phycisphaerae bacterium]
MRTLVAGAAGFIGYHLARRLLTDGDEVVGLDNLVSGQRQNAADLSADARFAFVEHDICEPLPDVGRFEVVINMACPASPVDFRDKAIEILRTCSVGVERLLDVAQRSGAVFVQASTSECYGDPLVHPQPETYWGNVNPIGVRAPYDEGKRFAEALVMSFHRRHGTATRIVRIFNTYGPRMRAEDGRALPTFIMQALRGDPLTIHGDGSQTRSFCYVDDLVDGIVRLAKSDFVEPINLGNDEEITVRQAAEEVIALTGGRSRLQFVERPSNDPERRRPDLTRALQVLGWRPTTPRREGFARTIEYFRSLQ